MPKLNIKNLSIEELNQYKEKLYKRNQDTNKILLEIDKELEKIKGEVK